MAENPATSADVSKMYDRMSELLMETLGDNIHYGYWDDENDTTPVREATDRLTDMVADRLKLAPGGKALDIGCGTGRSTRRIAERQHVHFTGVTVSPHEVHLAMAQPGVGLGAGQASFQLADAMDLPFQDGAFDGAIAIESIEHMPDRTKAFREIGRTLRPGAHLVVQDFFLAREPSAQDIGPLSGLYEISEFTPFSTEEVYRKDIDEAGFDVVSFENVSDHLRRTTFLIMESMRKKAAEDGIDGESRELLTDWADRLEALVPIDQIRHGIITMRRR